MNRRTKAAKTFMLFLSVCLVLSGCSKGNTDKKTEATNETKAGTQSKSGELALPFVKDGSVTLTYAGVDNWYAPASYTKNLDVWKEVEKRTGVKIKWEVTPSNQYNTTMQTRIAAGTDLPDIIAVPPLWGGNVVRYGDEGTIIPLDDLIEKNAPDIVKLFQQRPEIKKSLRTPDGHIYCLAEVANTDVTRTAILRNDWLKKLNLKEPTNLDEWYNVLKAFKTRDPNGNGKDDEIPLTSIYGITDYSYFGSAFGIQMPIQDFSVDANGKVAYTYQLPQMKSLIEYLNKLYKEKLMDPEFMSNDEAKSKSQIARNIVGANFHNVGVDATWTDVLWSAGVKDAEYLAQFPLKGPDGKASAVKKGLLSMEFAITKSCKNPDIAMKWMSYLWANPEGSKLVHYGIEGQTYTANADGSFKDWMDVVSNNPQGLDPINALRSIGAGYPALLDNQGTVFVDDIKKLTTSKHPESIKRQEDMKKYLVYGYPKVYATKDENAEFTKVMADIYTYTKESMQKFIMGIEPLSNYDNYLNRLNALNIGKAVQIKQQQYDRYSKE